MLLPIETAPKDGTHILLWTSDFGWIEGWWDHRVINFYKSQKGWASYDPDNMHGEWISHFEMGGDRRLYCGATPHFWMPLPEGPTEEMIEAQFWGELEDK